MNRTARAAVPALTAVSGLVLATTLTGLSAAPADARVAIGKTFTLQSGTTLSGYDAATSKKGTTYVAWIGDKASTPGLRNLNLCVLKTSSRSCVGGVQTTSALGDSSAKDVKVVISGGQVQLVWIAQVAASTREFSGVFGTNTVTQNTLGTSVAVPGAPTLGSLTGAIAHRGGGVSLAAIGESGSLNHRAYYYPTVSATPKTFVRPYFVGNAQLADNGKQTVFTTSQYASISGKVAVTRKGSNGSAWRDFRSVKGSYTLAGAERLVNAGGHIRMVGVSGRAIYHAFTWKWNGKSFGKPRPTGDHNDISSIDAVTDGSGRLVTADVEVGGIMVSNFGQGSHAARFRFKVKQTFAGGPAQISTRGDRRGFLIWGIQKQGVTGQVLKAQAIKVPPLPRHHHRTGVHARAVGRALESRGRS